MNPFRTLAALARATEETEHRVRAPRPVIQEEVGDPEVGLEARTLARTERRREDVGVDDFLRDEALCARMRAVADKHPQSLDAFDNAEPLDPKAIAESCDLGACIALDRERTGAEGYSVRPVQSFEEMAAERRRRRAQNVAHLRDPWRPE